MALSNKNMMAYSIGQGLSEIFNPPIVSNRAPRTNDRAPIGQCWIDKINDDVYFLTSIVANVSAWQNSGGGSGSFDSLAVTNAATIGGTAIITGAVTLSNLTPAGVVLNSVAGLLSTITGTDAQVLMADTAAGLDFGAFTSGGGSIVLTYPAPHTINLEATGGTANSYVTDTGGPVAPLVGVLDIVGYDANITTNGVTANTVRIRLADDITSVASITATADFDMLGGACEINSTENGGDAIYLHTDGGVNEQIHLHAEQGTGISSITIESDVGGIVIASDMASADAININASNAAGGIDMDYGTNGMTIDGANGAFTLQVGTGNILLGTDVADHDITIGDNSGVNAMSLVSGTGHTALTSTGNITIVPAGDALINTTAGDVYIASTAVAQNVSIATGAAAMALTLGNVSGATAVVVDCGTGGASFGASATAHATTLGSTNTTSATTIQAGSGAVTVTAGGAFDVNAVGAATIDSTGGAISIGSGANDFAVNISTGGTRLTTIGNGTATSSIAILSGTSGIDIGVNAIAKTVRLGSTTGASALTLQAGSGDFVQTAGGIWDVNVVGAVTVDGASAAITSSSDAAKAIYLHSNAGTSETIEIENTQGTDAAAIALTSTAGGVVVTAATALGIKIDSAGSTDIVHDTGTAASSSITMNKRNGVVTLTGLTTAAAGTQRYTITSSVCQATSGLYVCVANKSAGNDCKITMQACTPGAGSFTVDTINNGAAALDSDVIINFTIIN